MPAGFLQKFFNRFFVIIMAMRDYRGESQNNTNTMDPRVEKIMIAAEYIAAKLDGRKPFAGIVLGSGLGKLAD